MTVVLKDAATFLSKDNDPIVGSISYENPLNDNTVLTINAASKVITLHAKQVKLAVFKLNNKEFGFIFKSTGYYTNNDVKCFNKWNENTKQILRRELKPCFLNEHNTRNGLIQ